MWHAQLEWHARQTIRDDIKVQLDLVSAQSGKRWTLAIEQPMRGGDPTFLWRPGEVILDDYALRLPDDLKQGPYLMEIRLLDVTHDEWLDFTDSAGKRVTHATVAPLWVGLPVSTSVRVPNPTPATFDRSIELLGFDLGQATLCKGQPLSLTLYWQASQPVEDDYTVFVHILDAQGRLIAQQDNPPLQGNLPTSLWVPGITLQDDYQIALPADCPAGMYTIQIGLYEPSTGERLLPNSSAGQVADRALRLAQIGQP
jgi:hypothetical protein